MKVNSFYFRFYFYFSLCNSCQSQLIDLKSNYWKFDKNSRNPNSLLKSIRFEILRIKQIRLYKHDKLGSERLRNFCTVLYCYRNSSSSYYNFVCFGHFMDLSWDSRYNWNRFLLADIFCTTTLFAFILKGMEEDF